MSVTLNEVRDKVLTKLDENVAPTSHLNKAILRADSLVLNAVCGVTPKPHGQVIITTSPLLEGGTWFHYGGAGISPSILSHPEPYPEWYYDDPHPWLTDLRSLARMLEGELKLPHRINFSGNSRQRRKARRREEHGYNYNPQSMRCKVCLEAAKRRRSYQRNKLLLKET